MARDGSDPVVVIVEAHDLRLGRAVGARRGEVLKVGRRVERDDPSSPPLADHLARVESG